MDENENAIEYRFLRQNTIEKVKKLRYSAVLFLGFFQIVFIILFGFFGNYADNGSGKYNGTYDSLDEVPKYYAMFQDVHVMMFIGFGFLMTFLKRYGYGSVGFNMLIAAYVIEWSLLVRGFIEQGIGNGGSFTISIQNLLVADFCAAAVLITFGAVLGKTTPTQLIIIATVEVVVQGINEYIGLHYFKAYDIGESMYVHAFGAYFGLALAKILHRKGVENDKEGAHYHSDIFSMIGAIFLWVFWPSFNSALAVEEGQMRAVVNTVLSISASCIATFIVSIIVGKGRINMVHVQNATLAGGVAVGTIADMMIHPYGAMIIGTVAGIVSTLGFQYATPFLRNSVNLHDTCGVNNLHGMPGLMSGIIGAFLAAVASREIYFGNNLYKFYPSRIPVFNSTDYFAQGLNETDNPYIEGGDGRNGITQCLYQLAALAVTLSIAIFSGIITGLLLKIPIFEKIKNEEDNFDDSPFWEVPEDYALKLSVVNK